MALIKSISGIRGTIGGKMDENLTPYDVVKFTIAYSVFLKENNADKNNLHVVVGRDARTSGEMVNQIVCGTLLSMGINVIDIGLTTTPTVAMKVLHSDAKGGIIITASHNPFNWNALKLLNEKGEFLSADEGEKIMIFSENKGVLFSEANDLGKLIQQQDAIDLHIKKILQLPLVDVESIRKRKFKIVVDCVNSSGGIVLPLLLKALGVSNIQLINGEPTGVFAHNPEPLPEHLEELCFTVKNTNADIGFAVDPDVDRLAIVQENGAVFGEEYTLVAVADYVLQHSIGNTVSNLSSTRALQIVTEKHGGSYKAAAVGEVNVVEKMKATNAVIGGEGNGGVIYPELHYGRDALVGIALFLSYLSKTKKTCSELRKTYPDFFISKNKILLENNIDLDALFLYVKNKYEKYPINDIDGLRIDFDKEWVHLRRSNTEPIIRIYAESQTEKNANQLASKIIDEINKYIENQ